MITARKILVGYDGSAESGRAARWALDDATADGARVAFCCSGDDVLRTAAITHPGVRASAIRRRTVTAADLVKLSVLVDLVVVGTPGDGLLLSSFAGEVAAHASCPTVVVRGRDAFASAGPVVVGLDETSSGGRGLGFAFAYAYARGLPVRAVHSSPAALHHDELDSWQAHYPAVPVTLELIAGSTTEALMEASGDARLVVVRSREHSRFPGAVLGRVAQRVLRYSPCPVAVVREESRLSAECLRL